MKKILSLMIVGTMLVAFTSCSGGKSVTPPNNGGGGNNNPPSKPAGLVYSKSGADFSVTAGVEDTLARLTVVVDTASFSADKLYLTTYSVVTFSSLTAHFINSKGVDSSYILSTTWETAADGGKLNLTYIYAKLPVGSYQLKITGVAEIAGNFKFSLSIDWRVGITGQPSGKIVECQTVTVNP